MVLNTSIPYMRRNTDNYILNEMYDSYNDFLIKCITYVSTIHEKEHGELYISEMYDSYHENLIKCITCECTNHHIAFHSQLLVLVDHKPTGQLWDFTIPHNFFFSWCLVHNMFNQKPTRRVEPRNNMQYYDNNYTVTSTQAQRGIVQSQLYSAYIDFDYVEGFVTHFQYLCHRFFSQHLGITF